MPSLFRGPARIVQPLLPLLFSRVAILLLATGVVLSLVFPWQAAGPRIYPGLDPNLIYVNARGTGTQSGTVQLSGDQAVLNAREGSAPTIHLASSESDFSAQLDVTPGKAAQPWQTAKITVQPPAGVRYFGVLVGVTDGTILFHGIGVTPIAADRSQLPAIFADDFSNPKHPSWYSAPGVDYPPGAGMQVTSPGKQEAGTYSSILGLTQPQPSYVISTLFRSVSGQPNFKVAIDWLDSQRRHISYGGSWNSWAGFQQPLIPASITIWHPQQNYAISLQFTGALRPKINAVTRDANAALSTKELGDYVPGSTYHVVVSWKHTRSAEFVVTGPDGKHLTYTLSRQSGFGLFSDPFANLSVSTSAPPGATSSLEISRVRLIIPSQTRFAQNVSDWRLTLLTWVIALWLIAYALTYLFVHVAAGGAHRLQAITSRLITGRNLAILAAIAALVPLYAAATVIDGHPFDRLTQEGAAYVIDQYGIGALYERTSAIPDSIIRGGTGPWNPAEFVYPPGMANFFIAVARIWQLGRGTPLPLGDPLFTSMWKLAFAIFIVAGAALIFAISRRLSPGSWMWPLLLAGLFALSPAVIFDVAVWGQSNGLLLAILLLAVLGLVWNRPQLMWSAIIVAVLVKQTALLVVPLIAIFALRRYGWRRSVTCAAFGTIVGFVFIAPSLLSGISPATAFSTTIGKLADFGTPLTPYNTTVSADTFPIWTVVTGMRGLHGIERLWTTDREQVPLLGMSYSTAGLVLFVLLGLIAAWAVWREAGRPNPSYQRLFLAIALVVVGYVSLNTRSSGHYLILAVPFLLLGLPRAAPVSAFWKVAAVSALALISEYGLFMFIAAKGEWPSFAVLGSPSTNAFSALVYAIYTYDGFITLFAVLMVVVMVRLLMEVGPDLRGRVAVPAHITPEVAREAAGG